MWINISLYCSIFLFDLVISRKIDVIINKNIHNNYAEMERMYMAMQVENLEYGLELSRQNKTIFDLRQQEHNCLTDNIFTMQHFSHLAYKMELLNEEFKSLQRQMNPLEGKIKKTGFEIEDRTLYYNEKLPTSCANIIPQKSGIYEIVLADKSLEPLRVFCDADTEGGNWTVIQRRLDGEVYFHRSWDAYRKGFGNLEGEFFIGLEPLYQFTNYEPQELIFILTDFDNVTKIAKYDSFKIGSENEFYAIIELGNFEGSAGDSFSENKYNKFATYDKDTYSAFAEGCANLRKGGWWHSNCGTSNLNGLNVYGKYDNSYSSHGISWNTFRGLDYSLKSSLIMIRPKKNI